MATSQYFRNINQNHMAVAMQQSFRKWLSTDPKYKKIEHKLDETGLELVDIALAELYEYRPFVYHHWWSTEHMRFTSIKAKQTRLVYELMYEFLSRYANGKLKRDVEKQKRKTKKNRRTATVVQ